MWEEDWECAQVCLKGGLKKLAKLWVNGKCIRLGTDWEGYKREDSDDEGDESEEE
jgi:hypothetical protein